jgi:hypothetical protein
LPSSAASIIAPDSLITLRGQYYLRARVHSVPAGVS